MSKDEMRSVIALETGRGQVYEKEEWNGSWDWEAMNHDEPLFKVSQLIRVWKK